MTPTGTPTPAPGPAPVAGVPISDSSALARNMAQVEQTAAIIGDYIDRNLREGVDFGAIKGESASGKQFTGKRVLFKPGAEKLTLALGLRVRFRPDFDTHQMAGSTPGLIALKCFLLDSTGAVVAEARGAANAGERKGWTINNAVKVAEKRAHVAAVLRVAALSDHFVTEEEEDHQAHENATGRAEKPQEPRQRSEPRTTAAPRPNAPAGQRQAAPPSPKARSWKAIKTLCGDMPETEVVGELNDFLRKHIRPGCTTDTATGDDWAQAAPRLETMAREAQPPTRPFAGPAPARQTKGGTPAEVADDIFS